MRRRLRSARLKGSIYLLPNMFTTLNLFCGFYAVIASISGNFSAAAVSIIIAGVFDSLDGKLARATNTTSTFGVEYDSLADVISFGMAPAVMVYLWALVPLGRIGWLAGFLFMACGALRLARFNTQVGTVSSDHFVGLPIPAGAGMVATTVMLFEKFSIGGNLRPVLILIMLYLLSYLMVSSIKYSSFKKPELFIKMNFNSLVVAILILIFVASQPAIALFVGGILYVGSGPAAALLRYRRIHQRKAEKNKDQPSTTA